MKALRLGKNGKRVFAKTRAFLESRTANEDMFDFVAAEIWELKKSGTTTFEQENLVVALAKLAPESIRMTEIVLDKRNKKKRALARRLWERCAADRPAEVHAKETALGRIAVWDGRLDEAIAHLARSKVDGSTLERGQPDHNLVGMLLVDLESGRLKDEQEAELERYIAWAVDVVEQNPRAMRAVLSASARLDTLRKSRRMSRASLDLDDIRAE